MRAIASVTVSNLPDETLCALRVCASTNSRNIEAEMRAILERTVQHEGRIKFGCLLADIGREVGGVDLEIAHDRTPAEPMSFD